MMTLSFSQQEWIRQRLNVVKYDALIGDAGFRRYFRLHVTPNASSGAVLTNVLEGDVAQAAQWRGDQFGVNANYSAYKDHSSYIFMDASAEPLIYQAFIAQTKHMTATGLPIPYLVAQDDEQAWAIIQDFGDDLLWQVLHAFPEQADHYYRQAIRHLIILHQHPVQAFGRFAKLDSDVMLSELQGWREWCLEGLFHQSAEQELFSCFIRVAEEVAQQPYVFIHRDYHSKNLLKRSDDSIGIIDYQDAMAGPLTYDIASLVRDCYIDWPEEKVIEWSLYYKQLAQDAGLFMMGVSDDVFLRWFDWTSIQRHLKALFTFSRKHLRDHNDSYLQFIPRTLRYLDVISSRYPELQALTQIIKKLREKNS